MLRRWIITLTVIIATTSWLRGETLYVALYDVGKLYDTAPSSFYDDSDYTPTGRNRWSEERYQRKIRNISGVIDSMAMPIVILRGVESESVVRDIVLSCKEDYSYIHRTLDYYTGLDFAILYFGDRLFVNKVRSNNYWLYVGGEIDNSAISIHLTLRGDRLHTTLPPESSEASDITLAWGNISRRDVARLKLRDPLRELERRSEGDTRGDKGWYFKNRVGVDVGYSSCGVYICEWLLDRERRAPLPTYSRSGYVGGYSNHLPQYISIMLQ